METYKSGLNAELTTISPCTLQLTATVPAEVGKKAYNRHLDYYSKHVQKPGFRAGHIPQSMILSLHGKEILSDTAAYLANQAVEEVVAEKKLTLASEIDIEGDRIPEYVPGQDFTVKATLEVFPEFELPEYKGLKATRKKIVIDDKQVDEAADTYLHMRGTYEKVERPAHKGDMVRVDYACDADDELKNDPRAKFLVSGTNAWQILRDPESIPGITAVMEGVELNGEKDAPVTFPEDFRIESPRGKTLNYHFTLREVHGFTPPAFDEEFEKQTGMKSLDDVKAMVRQQMERNAEVSQENNVYEQIVKEYSSKLSFEIPPKHLARVLQESNEIEKQRLESRGLKGEELEKELEKAEQRVAEDVPKTIRLVRAYDLIAQKENIQITTEEVYGYCARNAQRVGMELGQYINELRKNRDEWNSMFTAISRQKVLALMVKEADITEVE